MKVLQGSTSDRDKAAEVRAAGQLALIVSIPDELLAPHAKQAMRNHSQTLAGLDSRGGLSACEMVAVLEDRSWRRMTLPEANGRLIEILRANGYLR